MSVRHGHDSRRLTQARGANHPEPHQVTGSANVSDSSRNTLTAVCGADAGPVCGGSGVPGAWSLRPAGGCARLPAMAVQGVCTAFRNPCIVCQLGASDQGQKAEVTQGSLLLAKHDWASQLGRGRWLREDSTLASEYHQPMEAGD